MTVLVTVLMNKAQSCASCCTSRASPPCTIRYSPSLPALNLLRWQKIYLHSISSLPSVNMPSSSVTNFCNIAEFVGQITLFTLPLVKTAHVFSKACQQSVDYPEISDSEHLLALSMLRDVAGKKVLILRGNGGRELIYSTLVERGATVRYQEAYCRHERPFAAAECVQNGSWRRSTHW